MTTERNEMTTQNLFHVIDYADKVRLYSGTFEECVLVQDTQYGGLTVISNADFVKYGTEHFVSIDIIPPDKHQMTWTLSIHSPEADIYEEYPSAVNAITSALSWMEKRGYEPSDMSIPVRRKS
jgi:hypothetical protein